MPYRAFTARFTTNDTGNIAVAAAPLMACSTTGPTALSARRAWTGRVERAGGREQHRPPEQQQLHDGRRRHRRRPGDDGQLLDRDARAPGGRHGAVRRPVLGRRQSAGGNGGARRRLDTATLRAMFKAPARHVPARDRDHDSTRHRRNTNRYQASSTSRRRVAAAGGGTYAVGNVRAGTGGDRYAGWSLVVAYRDTAQPARNLTVFDGLTTIASNAPPTTIPVSGFQTPPAGPVRTTLGFVSYEGDLGPRRRHRVAEHDDARQRRQPGDELLQQLDQQQRRRRHDAQPGVQRTRWATTATSFNADGILANGATNATIGLTTNSDQYLPGVVTFATELYAPIVVAAEERDQRHASGRPGPARRRAALHGHRPQHRARTVPTTSSSPTRSRRARRTCASSLRIAGTAGDRRRRRRPGEFAAGANRVVFRLGTGANATLGGRLAPGAYGAGQLRRAHRRGAAAF